MVSVILPDKSRKELPDNSSARDLAFAISKRLGEDALAARINGQLVDITTTLQNNATIELITTKSKEALEILRHTTAHIFAQAITRLFPQAKITIGPAIENGFYYDVDCDQLTDSDLPKIEAEMKKIVAENLEITPVQKTKKEALSVFKNNEYKRELIEAISKGTLSKDEEKEAIGSGDSFTFYKQGTFEDLCRGPHLPKTGLAKAFKLDKITKAYWRGKAENKQLNRVYGFAFFKQAELDEFMKLQEEAKKRDHRIIGKQLKLFMFHEYSPGSPFFLPRGFVIWRELQALIREQYRLRKYEEVMTPNMFNSELWKTSGHWEHYKDDMFILQSENQEFALKPMNCPSHCLIFKNDFRTYKDLPWRVADFGALHRNELSGALSGLTRVRKFCQDDCHIFAKLEDIESEIDGLLQFVDYVYGQVFKIPYEVNLSTRPEKYLGTIEMWDGAEKSLMKALDRNKQQYKLNPGDGAFYGPKLDFRIKDCLGRMHQTATIQLDFNLPIRFELEYEGADGKRHKPVMIHRAMLGSVERFMAVMTEHFEGKFPLWLSPVQVEIITVADRHIDYAKTIEKELFSKEFRVETRFDAQTVANKIRLAREEDKPNYMIIIGDENVSKNTLSVRTRKFENGKNEEFETTLADFAKRLEQERKTRSIYF